MTRILDGREVAKKMTLELERRIAALKAAGGVPTLATVRVGDAQDAVLYSKSIEKLLAKLGLGHRGVVFPGDITEASLREGLRALDRDDGVTGILVFSPLPEHLRSAKLFEAVSASKDVEGRRLFFHQGEKVMPPTAESCLRLIRETGVPLEGKEAVIIGRSDVVGKPAAILLLEANATVTLCHSKTRDLKGTARRADILVVSIGRPHFVKSDWIKEGAIVIDVGENVVDGRLVGDVDPEGLDPKASFYTPVPGGVGPLTNIMLAANLLKLNSLAPL